MRGGGGRGWGWGGRGRGEVCLVICLVVHVERALRRTRRRGEGNSRLFEANSNCFSSFFLFSFFVWWAGRRGGGGGGEEGEEKIRAKTDRETPPECLFLELLMMSGRGDQMGQQAH